MNQSPIFWICIALIVFIVAREVMLWYWRITDIVKYQQEQLDIMDEMIKEIRQQNIMLHTLMYEEKKETEEPKKEESTPE